MFMSRRQLIAGIAAAGLSGTASARERTMVRPFQIPFDAGVIADLNHRLDHVRWADAVTSDWSMGAEREFMQRLVGYWRHNYDWSARVELLNRLPHFRADVDGCGVHFLHFRSADPGSVPLLLMNGWPSSFVEYQRLAPVLAAGAPAFDVVIPTMPGFGFSDRPTRPYQFEPSDLYPKLMTMLGYDRFVVAGTDIGSGIATRIALHHPNRVLAVHVPAVPPKPRSSRAAAPTSAEREYEARAVQWQEDEGGYQAIQSSRPQTLAFGLADSPVGLAGWIVEKYRAWSDCDGDVLSVWPRESLLDTLMVYWTTNTIASSVRYYYEASRLRPALKADDYVTAPTAIAMWPHDLALAPRELAEQLYNVRRYTIFPKGGHFPAWEAPTPYANDLRKLVQGLAA